jgi:predicted transcriptional regulator of viral defense system
MMIIPNMRTDETLKDLEKLPYFTIEGLITLLGKNPHECSVVLNRWKKKGYILKVKRGYYVTKEYVTRHIGDYDYMSSIASLIDPNSYVSLEFVLQNHSILTEAVYAVTAVTLKTTRKYHSDLGDFYYKNIKPKLFGNYIIKNYNGLTVKEATLEKALFDYMYFRPFYQKGRRFKYNIAEDLRLNLEVFTQEQIDAFNKLCTDSGIKKMVSISKNFEEYKWNQI